MALDLGCGKKKREGAVGIDFNDRTDADIIHNLNEFPYPVEPESFDEVYLDNCLEHLDHPVSVMEEVHRITKPGALIKVIVPYFRSAYGFIDLTHTHYFTTLAFAFFDPDHHLCNRYVYTKAHFKTERIVFNETVPKKGFGKLILKLANKWPLRYEYYLSHLFPLDDLTFYLRRV